MNLLQHAPIREAVIDIAYDDIQLSGLKAAFPQLQREFPQQHDIRDGLVSANFGPEGLQISGDKLATVGRRFSSVDGTKVLGLRSNGLALSYVPNRQVSYPGWEVFFGEYWRFWEQITNVIGPLKVNRVATRFINSIPLPMAQIELNSYFTSVPSPPSSLPQILDSYFSRMVVPFIDSEATAVVQQGLEIAPDRSKQTGLIDIDVFSASPSREFSIDEVKVRLADLRRIKNLVFRSLLTDSCWESMK